jgi:chromate transporter
MASTAWTLFLTFFKVGALSFGGGPAAITLMREELTTRTDLTDQDFTDGLAVSSALPGPIISNVAVFAGLKLGGIGAALAGLFGSILAPCAFMLVAAWWITANQNLPLLQAALKGVRPAVIALLAFTVIKLAPASISQWDQVAIGLAALASLLLLHLHPAFAIILSGLVGIVLYR